MGLPLTGELVLKAHLHGLSLHPSVLREDHVTAFVKPMPQLFLDDVIAVSRPLVMQNEPSVAWLYQQVCDWQDKMLPQGM